MILRSRVLYCNVHSPSLLTIHSRLFTITNDQGCYSNVPFLAWDLKRTFQLCSFCTSFWGPGPQWAVVRRPWLAAHLVPSLCAARIQQHSSTVQHPQGPNNSLNNFKSLHFDCSIFGETWDQRETAGAVLAILRFTGHRFLAQIVPSLRSQGEQTAPVQYHSRYWWEVLHGCLQFTESILNDSQWVHKMHGLEMKAFSSFFHPHEFEVDPISPVATGRSNSSGASTDPDQHPQPHHAWYGVTCVPEPGGQSGTSAARLATAEERLHFGWGIHVWGPQFCWYVNLRNHRIHWNTIYIYMYSNVYIYIDIIYIYIYILI